jgi:transposase InsO family protein
VANFTRREGTRNRRRKTGAARVSDSTVHSPRAHLVAVIDWYSRKVLSWRLSNTVGCRGFCLEALSQYGTPEIFNTDQGCQFTSDQFTSVLKAHSIRISMDGTGWYSTRSSSKDYGIPSNTRMSISSTTTACMKHAAAWWLTSGFYNLEWPHQALDEQTSMRDLQHSYRSRQRLNQLILTLIGSWSCYWGPPYSAYTIW